MNSRPLLILILALSLVFLMGVAIQWWMWRHAPTSTRVLPSHSWAELWTTPTYKRTCLKNEDCVPPLACTSDQRVQGQWCLGSECDSDLQCNPGLVCRPVPTLGAPIRLCVAEGLRKEGETCEYLPRHKEESCEAGLVCNRGYCGRPCRPDAPASCPEGMACFESILGNSCVPSCLKRGCPEGKRCFRIEGDLAVCGVLEGTDCETSACPAGQRCGRNPVMYTDRVLMWCFTPCGQELPCEPGSACIDGSCLRRCEVGAKGVCGPNEVCAFFPSLQISACSLELPDWLREEIRRNRPWSE